MLISVVKRYHVILGSTRITPQIHVDPQLWDTKPAVKAIRVATEPTITWPQYLKFAVVSCVNRINESIQHMLFDSNPHWRRSKLFCDQFAPGAQVENMWRALANCALAMNRFRWRWLWKDSIPGGLSRSVSVSGFSFFEWQPCLTSHP
jgi:hypothetical protein